VAAKFFLEFRRHCFLCHPEHFIFVILSVSPTCPTAVNLAVILSVSEESAVSSHCHSERFIFVILSVSEESHAMQ